jgi:predicted lipoprotein with Yx(FWY)xxD motif
MFTGRIAAFGIGLALMGAACSGAHTTSAPAAGSASATISVEQVPGVGNVYTDADGMALYSPAQEASGKVKCVGECTSVWIPLPAPASSGSASEAPGVGVITRPDGTKQVSLNGAPLYRFFQDSGAGTANGNGITDSFGGVTFTWHVASPDGSTTSSNTSSGGYSYGSGH